MYEILVDQSKLVKYIKLVKTYLNGSKDGSALLVQFSVENGHVEQHADCFDLNTQNRRMFRTIILPVVFYGCETWYKTFLFLNEVIMTIYGSTQDMFIVRTL